MGVIFYQFNKAQKNEKSKTAKYLSEDQQRWIEMHKLILSAKPKDALMFAPKHSFSLFFQKIILHKAFDPVIMVVIILNIIIMAASFDDSSNSYQSILKNLNLAFTAIFMLEMILKFLALGPRGYWYSTWNKFDAFVVASSVVDLVLGSIGSNLGSFLRVGPQLARVLRVLRVSRLLRLVKGFQGIASLIETIVFSLPSMLNIFSLLFIVFFIYAVLGVFLYKNITTGQRIGEFINFSDFGNAMSILFRCSTGEDWYIIMYDTLNIPPNCTPNVNCGTCKQFNLVIRPNYVDWSYLYFITFIIALQFIMLNMFILIILENFDEYYFKPDNPLKRFKDSLEAFSAVWVSMTAKSDGIKIHKKNMITFFEKLEEPLGMKGQSHHNIAKAIFKMNLTGSSIHPYALN